MMHQQPETDCRPALSSPPCADASSPGLFSGAGTNVELSVEKTFDEATVFITGATGFVGSVVLEQLLRVCPTVKKVFLLIRVKRGQSGDERLAQLLRKKLFHLHWKGGEVPLDVRNKIVVVPGDMDAPGLGLSDADRQSLQAEVDFVIHSAASISFFEHVHTLLKQNYEATRKTVELARGMNRMRGFIHVSTAYVNSNLPRGSHIEERIYPLHDGQGGRIQHAALAARLAALPPAKAEHTAQGVLRATGLPNCYTLTKHMCEELVDSLHCDAFPVSIVRPTIIGAIANSPLPGYFGNAAGVTSAALAFATGMARFTCHNPHNVYDIIPCDLVASAILVACAALQQPVVALAKRALVVHSGSSCTNPCSYFDLFTEVIHPFWSANPPERRLCNKPYKRIGHPTMFVPENSMLFKAMRVKHDIRFKALATGLRMAGHAKLASMVQNSWKIWKLYNTSTMDFHLFYCARNLAELQAHLRPSERVSCQVVWSQADNWIPYFTTHMHAIRAKYFPTTVVKTAEGKVEVEAVASPADEKLQQEPLPVQALPPHALLPRFSNTALPPNALPPRFSNRLSVKFSGRVHPLQDVKTLEKALSASAEAMSQYAASDA